MRYQDIARLVLAAAFFAGAGANTVMVLAAPGIYEGFADLALLRFYKSMWRNLILPRLRLCTALVVAFEVAVGVLLLAPGLYARLGLILGAAYTLLLVPFWWAGGAMINVLLFSLMVWLLRFNYAESIVSLLCKG
jgi:hypothetical protein